jgi:hypothetical protein
MMKTKTLDYLTPNYCLSIRLLFLSFFFLLILNSCSGKRDITLWTIGSTIFLMFAAIILLNLLIPFLHEKSFFQKLIEKARKPAKILGVIFSSFGLLLIISGALYLSGDFGPKKLTFFLGIILLIFGGNIIFLAKAGTPEKQAFHAKLASICIGFIIALIYIMRGAPGILE